MTILDRIFPSRQTHRSDTRGEAKSAPWRRMVEAAGGGRRGKGLGRFSEYNAETLASAPQVRSRARFLAVNDGYVSNGVNNFATALTGSGIRPALIGDTAKSFEEWASGADHDGQSDFFGMQGILARHLMVDGEALVILHTDEIGELGLQILPPEMLDEAKTANLEGGGEVVAGVEFDASQRRVAYWIHQQNPASQFSTYVPSVRVDAAHVCHIVHPLAAAQVRGMSWLAPAVLPASALNQYLDALLVSAKTSALVAGFITDVNQTGALPFDGEQAGSILDSGLEPGALKFLPAGLDVKFLTPEQTKDAPAMIRLHLQGIAAAIGVPTHLLDNDLSGANYSSLRAGLLPFRARVEAIQYGTLVPQFLAPVFTRWLALEVAAGRLDADPSFRPEWIMPRPMQVDPAKDTKALGDLLDRGLMSRTQAANELGWSVQQLDEEIAADVAREAELGLSFTNAGGAKDAA